MRNCLTSTRNIAIGAYSMFENQGQDNIGIGGDVLNSNLGSYNIAMGNRVMTGGNMSNNNIALGYKAHSYYSRNTEDGMNIIIGNNTPSDIPNYIGNNNIFLGHYNSITSGTDSNIICIGNSSIVTNNTITFGSIVENYIPNTAYIAKQFMGRIVASKLSLNISETASNGTPMTSYGSQLIEGDTIHTVSLKIPDNAVFFPFSIMAYVPQSYTSTGNISFTVTNGSYVYSTATISASATSYYNEIINVSNPEPITSDIFINVTSIADPGSLFRVFINGILQQI